MNTLKMIAEIKATCATLEAEKAELMTRVKAIDDNLTGFRMAIDSLEMTMPKNVEPEKPVVDSQDATYGKNTIVEMRGKKQTLTEWAHECGMTYAGLYYRLTHGWSMHDAISKGRQQGVNGAKKKNVAKKVFAYDAHDNTVRQYQTLSAASKDLKLPETTIKSTIANVSKEDQLKSRGYYLAFAK